MIETREIGTEDKEFKSYTETTFIFCIYLQIYDIYYYATNLGLILLTIGYYLGKQELS